MALDAGTIRAPCGWEPHPDMLGYARMKECKKKGAAGGGQPLNLLPTASPAPSGPDLTQLWLSGWSGLDTGNQPARIRSVPSLLISLLAVLLLALVAV
ncbi:hypothetical protein [Polycladidibacter hongkongensis]|uniref:hypothetical protein n=1 Tax=Polycladidibacter hongkongensis TaxID=1647556 RepID=UPI000835AE29|nr:hypothetical protein [Pseudovibrio hongkongensis]